MALGIIGSIVGGLAQAGAARSAQRAQERAAQDQIQFATQTRDQVRSDLAPFYTQGIQAQNALASIFGLRPSGSQAPNVLRFEQTPASTSTEMQTVGAGRNEQFRPVTTNTPATYGFRVGNQTFANQADAQAYADSMAGDSYQSPVKAPWELGLDDFEASPGYDFRLNQGTEAVQAGAAGRYGLNSGATQAALMDYGQGMASNEYGDFYNRQLNNFNALTGGLSSFADSGQNAAAGMGAAGSTAGGQVIGALGSIGNAGAAGAVGVGNAFSDGIGNAVGAWQFNNLLAGQNNQTGGQNSFAPFNSLRPRTRA